MSDGMALDMALAMASAGYRIAPVTIRRDPETGRKRPNYHRMSWDEVATDDPEQIQAWSERFGGSLGFVVSMASTVQLVGIDLDLKTDAFGAAEIDAVTWWAEQGLPISTMCVDTPSGGRHMYFRMPDEIALPNSTSAIAPGVDVRGVGGHFYAPGTRVVGDVEPYRLIDPLLRPEELPQLPDEVVKLIPEPRRKPRDRGQGSSSREIKDDRWVVQQCKDQLARVRNHPAKVGTGFRGVVMGAAMILGRAVAGGIADRDHAHRRLVEAVTDCWGAVDAEDQEWIVTGLDDGEADPWTIVPAPVATEEHVPAQDEDPDAYQRAYDSEKRKERIRRAVRAELAAEDRKPLRRMSAEDFLDAPQPTYLVPGLLYEDSLAVVFGPPGAAKTFFVLDVALSLATGRMWRGDVVVPRTRVHYLMAEGQAVNVGRTLAWLAHHGVDRHELPGWFDPFPEPVTLTPEGIQDYLREAEQDRPGLIVLDTKHAMMDGDESKAADVKVMRDALSLLRAATGACVLLVDHTGLTALDRARGSNSQKAMVATEIRLEQDGPYRTAEITRNTAGVVTGSWTFELKQVTEVPHPPHTDPPAVPVPVQRGRGDVPLRSSCWSLPREALPSTVGEVGGKVGETALDIFRALHEARDRDGLTVPQIMTLIKDSPREHPRTQVYRAVDKLSEIGVLEHALGGKSWLLAPAYADWYPAPEQAE